MSAVRDYLEAKAALGPKEWLRREPRETHPEILSMVREIIAAGAHYDDDVERQVNERVGDLPPHIHHGHPERHPLVSQLGHEVYIARGVLLDEEATAEISRALDDGYVPLSFTELVDGDKYLVRLGTVYSGHEVPVYGEPRQVRAKRDIGRWVFLPKGAKTRYFVPSGPALVKRHG